MNKPRVASVSGMELHTSGWVPPSDLYAQVLNNRAQYKPVIRSLCRAGLVDIFKETPALKLHLDRLFKKFKSNIPYLKMMAVFRSVVDQDNPVTATIGTLVDQHKALSRRRGGLNVKYQEKRSDFQLGRKNGFANCLGHSILLTTLLRMAGIKAGIKTTLSTINEFGGGHAYVIAMLHGAHFMLDPTCGKIERTEESADPDNWAYAAYITNMNFQSKSLEEELEKLGTALQINPDWAAGWEGLGTVYTKLGERAPAEACYRKNLALAPKISEPWARFGEYLLIFGEHQEALGYFEKAIELAPKNLHHWHRLACAYACMDDDRSAEAEAISHKILDAPSHEKFNLALTLNNLGNVRFEQGRMDEAMEYYVKALKIDPYNKTIWNNLIYISAKTGYSRIITEMFKELFGEQPADKRAIELREKLFSIQEAPSTLVYDI